MNIKFNKPYISKNSYKYIKEAITSHKHSGEGPFSEKCESFIENLIGCKKAIITPSCTAALEISALLLDISKDDEVIMPSYTFVSTANAFVLRGAKPVFIDVKEESLNIDEDLIEKSINKKTKAIVVVHYGGISCDMDKILKIAKKNNLPVIEDAAQGFLSKHKNKYLGSIGDIGCFSFHETKNISCGEGGAILINNKKFVQKAKIIQNKGTNINDFKLGLVNKYEWIALGSSYLVSEITSSFLFAQLENSDQITLQRLKLWNKYKEKFSLLEKEGLIKLQRIKNYSENNAHIFYLLLKDNLSQKKFIKFMKENSIDCSSHYVPLHNSPYGKNIINKDINMKVTLSVSNRIVRLPLWVGLDKYQDYIIQKSKEIIRNF